MKGELAVCILTLGMRWASISPFPVAVASPAEIFRAIRKNIQSSYIYETSVHTILGWSNGRSIRAAFSFLRREYEMNIG
jgi:hypothetical protein